VAEGTYARCRWCGDRLITRQRQYCSLTCSNQRTNAAKSERQPRASRVCEVCGRSWTPQGGLSFKTQRTCSRACGVILRQTITRTLVKAPLSPRPVPHGNCAVCGEDFVRRGSRKVCSLVCAQERKHGRDMAYNKTRPRVTGACRCGGPLPTSKRKRCDTCRTATKRRRKQCERRRVRAKRAGANRERYTLAEIAERDNYRCGLCHRRMDMHRTAPHPRAPTIDHLIPLDSGGDDTRANVQLACFHCNSVKGNRGGGEQLALFG